MSAHADLLTVAESYRRRAAAIPEEATRLHYDPAPLIREMNEKAALYEACAQDIAGVPEEHAEPIARSFRVYMWLRDERDYRDDREPDDYHP